MPEGPELQALGGPGGGTVAMLPLHAVPDFIPGVTDPEEYTTQLKFLAKIWPEEQLKLLVQRAALNVKGSAFEKLTLQPEILEGPCVKALEQLCGILGGDWGSIDLQDKFGLTERALYQIKQQTDEKPESYVTRCDMVWTKLLKQGVTLEQIQAYIVLRQSNMELEYKKRVILQSGTNFSMSEVKKQLKILRS
jgi:hypothetical protein